MNASSVDSAFAFSITGGLCDAASSWVPSVLSCVVGGTSTPAPTPVPAPAPDPAPVPTPVVIAASERTSQDDAASLPQRISVGVRKAAAAEARPAPVSKASKKKALRLSRSKASSSDSSAGEVLQKRRRSQKLGRPVSLPFACARSPFPPCHGDEAVHPEVQRPNGSSGSANDAETAWKQVRNPRALVLEQQPQRGS